jgi:hypothetical protein
MLCCLRRPLFKCREARTACSFANSHGAVRHGRDCAPEQQLGRPDVPHGPWHRVCLGGGAQGSLQASAQHIHSRSRSPVRTSRDRSEWHRHNLKRKVANLQPITKADYESRLAGAIFACAFRICSRSTWPALPAPTLARARLRTKCGVFLQRSRRRRKPRPQGNSPLHGLRTGPCAHLFGLQKEAARESEQEGRARRRAQEAPAKPRGGGGAAFAGTKALAFRGSGFRCRVWRSVVTCADGGR